MANFEYFNVMDIDPTFKPIDKAVYALRLNKLAKKDITIKNGPRAGQEDVIVEGSFTVINDDTFSGRRLRESFWLSNAYAQKGLRRLVDAIGVPQEPGESLADYTVRVSAIEPKPEFKVFVNVKVTGVDEGTGKPIEDNVIVWNQATAL